ncbi:hypothetical protein G7B40_012845 [Aetokthonos hydrillicola Thurmond2011]|jgi:hypothetical protein|uniref:Uncharacterized protein n=1 Tax=Aetokthonos hydrillicola Thurmond2011 TaxID=2712845 RepID=A0AAP5I808_9CYAN|nr:hypothetical protein [Aetokthonos hydrillicola]MDR9895449.1 hypothetical protein [Aetokthonos hydrillicola Thurmond2011]
MEVNSEKKLDKELSDEINEAQKSAYFFLKNIDDNEKNKSKIKKIFDMYNKYINLLQQEIRLINEHKIKQAMEFVSQQVDPTFLMLNNEINSLSNFYENQKQKAVEISNIEITIVLFLGSGIIGGLFLVYNRFVFNKNQQLEKTLNELKETQSQLIQTEKNG